MRIRLALLAVLSIPLLLSAASPLLAQGRKEADPKYEQLFEKKWSAILPFQILSDVAEVEPNENRTSAQALGCGNTLRPALIAAGAVRDTDWVSFSANSGDLLTIGTDADGATNQVGDTRIGLVDGSGTVLASDDDAGPGLYSLISAFPAPYTGTYYVRIAAYSSETGGYKAFVTCETPQPPPANDQCAGAPAITCGPIQLSGTTQFATDDYTPATTSGGCTGYVEHGRDVAYVLDVSAGDSLCLVYTNAADGAIYLISDCSNPTGTCVFGRDSSVAGGAESLRYKFAASGTYYLILDSYGTSTGGSWTASGNLVCGGTPPPPANDQCAGAIALPCGAISASGSTEFAGDDYTLSASGCTGRAADGRDVVYKVTVIAGDSLAVDYASSADGSIDLVGDCADPEGTCLAGADAAGTGGTETLRHSFASAGTFFLILDSYGSGSFGTWTLTGSLQCPPPVNDACAGALTIPCGPISLAGNTLHAVNDYDFPSSIASCTHFTASGKDVAYRLDAGAGDSLWIDYHSTADGSIYLVTACDTVSLHCLVGEDSTLSNQTETLRYRFTSGGTCYLVVDSYGAGSSGAWTAVGEYLCSTLSVDDAGGPARLAFRSVIPNPFAGRTALGITVPTRARVTLRIHDLQGRAVRTLADETMEPGERSFVWDGRDTDGRRVQPGVYFARLSGVDGSSTRRMVFVK